MKQYCIFDKDFKEIEYHELDNNGKIFYSQFTSYWDNGNPYKIKDTNGWLRLFKEDGGLFHEHGKPKLVYQDEYLFDNGGTISGVFYNCVAGNNNFN